MFDNLTNRLNAIFDRLRGYGRLTEENVQEALREVRVALLEADVNFKVVKGFIERVREKAVGQDVLKSLTPGQHVVKVVCDAKGRALYRNDQERGKMVLCVGQCVKFWKPLISKGAPKGKSLPGKLALAKRPGGAMQVTYNGKRLYTFTLDRPGKVTGDNFRDAFGGQAFTWHVVRAGKAPTSSGSGSGGYGGGYGYGG